MKNSLETTAVSLSSRCKFVPHDVCLIFWQCSPRVLCTVVNNNISMCKKKSWPLLIISVTYCIPTYLILLSKQIHNDCLFHKKKFQNGPLEPRQYYFLPTEAACRYLSVSQLVFENFKQYFHGKHWYFIIVVK